MSQITSSKFFVGAAITAFSMFSDFADRAVAQEATTEQKEVNQASILTDCFNSLKELATAVKEESISPLKASRDLRTIAMRLIVETNPEKRHEDLFLISDRQLLSKFSQCLLSHACLIGFLNFVAVSDKSKQTLSLDFEILKIKPGVEEIPTRTLTLPAIYFGSVQLPKMKKIPVVSIARSGDAPSPFYTFHDLKPAPAVAVPTDTKINLGQDAFLQDWSLASYAVVDGWVKEEENPKKHLHPLPSRKTWSADWKPYSAIAGLYYALSKNINFGTDSEIAVKLIEGLENTRNNELIGCASILRSSAKIFAAKLKRPDLEAFENLKSHLSKNYFDAGDFLLILKAEVQKVLDQGVKEKAKQKQVKSKRK